MSEPLWEHTDTCKDTLVIDKRLVQPKLLKAVFNDEYIVLISLEAEDRLFLMLQERQKERQ